MFCRRFYAGLKIGTITTFLSMVVLTVFLRYAFSDVSWENFPEVVQQDFTIGMIVTLASFCFLSSFAMAFWAEKQTIEAERAVKKFAEKYKVGNSFWAIHESIRLSDFGNKKALLSKIFHIRIKEIKKRYFTVTDDFRSKWAPARIGLGDFIVFKNKAEMIRYVMHSQNILRENMKKAVESV